MIRPLRTASLLGVLSVAVIMLAAAPGQAFTGPALSDPHVGVPVSAPPPPTVGGEPAERVERNWLRCRRYGVLVDADRPAVVWHLDYDVADGALKGAASKARRFDGVNDSFGLAGPDVTGRKPYTLELWARPSTADSRYRFLVSRETTTTRGRQGTGVWLSSAALGFERWTNGVKAGVTYAAGLPRATWSAVTATYDGSTMRLYVGGRLVGSRATSAPLASTTGPFHVGAGAGGGSGFFAGDLDELAIYGHALTRSHVAGHVSAGVTAPCTQILGEDGPSYTPTVDDLGDTLRVVTTSTRTSAPAGTVTSASESRSPADVAGQLVRPKILTPVAGSTITGTVQLIAEVAGLPPDRVELLVDGVARYAKDEPPFQYTWHTAAERNGSHTVAVRVYGPRSQTSVTSSRTVSTSNKTVFPRPLPFGKESMYAEFNEGDAATANNLLDDVWPARGFPLPKLGWPLTWQEDPYQDAYWRFYFYGLRPETSLLYVWQTTGATRYRDKLVAILRSFAAYDAIRPVETRTFDNNHAAAYRAMALVNYYFKLQRAGALPTDLKRGLEGALARLGAFLADPVHFEGGVNHGFNEGAALLLLARNFPAMPGAARWRQIAISRLEEMLHTTLDSDGVEVENSPFYHVYVLGLVYQIATWARQHEPALASSYTQAAQRMLRYAAYVTQPNGYLPMLGATATTYLPSQDPTVYAPMAAGDPEFEFAYTRGASGTPPPNGTYLFPSSGLFLMRSPLTSRSALAQQTFVTFDAGPYRTEHSDLDALGITMYSHGSTVLPESGLFTYTKQPERSYFHGTRAHNTVVVDGRDQARGAATADGHGNTAGSTWASGTSALYSGVTHRRSVVVLRQGLTLVVDRLGSSTSHSYAQTWHLAPNASLRVSGQDVTVHAPGVPVLAIRQANQSGMTLATIKGQTSPALQGWYSSSYGSKVPAWALEYRRSAPSVAFATLLAASPYASQPATVTRTPIGRGNRIDLCVNRTIGYSVTVPAAGSPVTVTGGGCR